MLVLHVIWAGGALRLWAEDDDRRPAADQPAAHPFAADEHGLFAAVAEAAGAAPDRVAAGTLTLWLPSTPAGPVASPELARPPFPAGAEPPDQPILPDGAAAPDQPMLPDGAEPPVQPELAAWRVPALSFPPEAGLTLLAALTDPARESESGPAPFATGGTVHYFAALARFAADLVARGRAIPVLAAEPAGHAARWRAVLTGADAAWARDLADAMPPLARAADPGGPEAAASPREAAGRAPGPAAGASPPPGAPAAEVLTAALDAFVDATARVRLRAGPPLLPPRRGRRPAAVPLAERWVAALTADDPGLQISGDEDRTAAVSLARDLAGWHAAAQAPAGPVRTCFRLVEPGADDDGQAAAPWRVEFALQSTDDPSLLAPAADIWARRGGPAAAIAAAGGTHPDELLLAGLGRAARLFPALEAELREAAPVAVTLDTEGAFDFLRRSAPLLAGAGFGVLLPAWARRARVGLKLTTRSAAPASAAVRAAGFGMEDLVDFRYDVAVGDQVLDPAELERLAASKVPLVRLRGQWVELDEARLRAALRFMERQQAGVMRASEAMLAGLRGGDEDLPPVEVDADGWLGDLLSGEADRRLRPVPAPATFDGRLRPYQERGLAWLTFLGGLGLGGILADDMGLGKTVQILALLAHERERADGGQPPGPALLVCPMSLTGNWQREAARFTPRLKTHVHHGGERLRGDDLLAELRTCDLVITTYGVAARDREQLAAVDWSRVVCDEAQNIKNPGTRAARAVRALPAGSRLALTGTPVENRLSDLWSLMEFASPGLLGPAETFRRRYAIPVEREGDEQAAAALKRLTGPFLLRRVKTDRAIISDLPDKLEMKVWCNLTPEQASLYQATVTDMMARVEGADDEISRRGLVLAAMARLKQVCNHPAHLLGDGSRLPGRSGKLARLEEICDEIVAAGEKALCFTQYAEFGGMLQPHLTARLGCPVLFLHGGTPKKQRDAMVGRFQELAGPAVFLLSLKAGGSGLNLTAANHVIHVDRWWNPAVEDQATDRAFRIGQRKDVQVRKFVCVGTLEERIDAMIEDKKALAERIVGTGEAWLTELSVAELRRVVELSPEAVSE